MWNSFERITWSFQKRLRVTYSIDADQDEGDRLDADHPEHQGQQPPVPLDVAQQRVGDVKGTRKKQTFCRPLEKSPE